MDRETLRKLIDDTAIHRVKPGDPLLPGKRPQDAYSWQFYLRRVLYRADVMEFIGREFKTRFAGASIPIQIAGVESAAVPLLMGIIQQWPEMPAFSIRKDQKTYGLKNWFEGIPLKRPVLLVDDLVSPHHYTFLHAIERLEEVGLQLVNRVFVLVNKRWKHEPDFDVIRLSDGNTVFVESIFTLDDFHMEWIDYHAK